MRKARIQPWREVERPERDVVRRGETPEQRGLTYGLKETGSVSVHSSGGEVPQTAQQDAADQEKDDKADNDGEERA